MRYIFDITKCMFSSGNISEKLRIAGLDCVGETVVDLYAGIGYFALPYLVHAGAKVVYACEWNPDAVEGLRRGLVANGIEDKCVIHFGDCRKVIESFMWHVRTILLKILADGFAIQSELWQCVEPCMAECGPV